MCCFTTGICPFHYCTSTRQNIYVNPYEHGRQKIKAFLCMLTVYMPCRSYRRGKVKKRAGKHGKKKPLGPQHFLNSKKLPKVVGDQVRTVAAA